MSRCAPFVQGATAFNVLELIAQGGIPEVATIRDNEVKILPSNRISAELQYSVRSGVTGTTLNDLAGGGGVAGIFGGLGGGAGAGIGGALGCRMLGDFEPTISKFIFHFMDGENRINRTITLTEQILEEARTHEEGIFEYRMPVPVAGVLGVTLAPLEFTVEELENIGASPGDRFRGWRIDSTGQISASFEPEDNLFVDIFRDERKYDYRGDNNAGGSRGGSNVFKNNGGDDLVDRKIRIKLTKEALNGTPQQGSEPAIPPLEAGNRLYISYYAVLNDELRHAIETRSFFFVFPGPSVARISIDQVKAWNFKPFNFYVHKEHNVFSQNIRADLEDLADDEETRANIELTVEQREDKLILEEIQGQRLIEVLNDTKTKSPFILGYYAADTRGIFSVDAGFAGAVELLIPADLIKDQEWWISFLDSFIDFGPGFTDNGELIVESDSSSRLLRGFLFDISDHVNSAVFDNEKYGYQRDLAAAIRTASKPDAENPDTTGIGFPNLDLIRNNVPGRSNYDLTSAKFDSVKMSSIEGGAYFVRSCNEFFVTDQACTSGTLQADMFIRTPFFFIPLSKRGRIFIERFTPQFALEPDGGIWVFTNPVGGESMSIGIHPYAERAYLLFADSDSSETILKWTEIRDSDIRRQLQKVEHDVLDNSLNHNPPDIESATQDSLDVIGFDKIIGNQPGYAKGTEITVEGGMIVRGLKNPSEVYEKIQPSFVHDDSNGVITVTGLDNRKIKNIRLRYTPTKGFLSLRERSATFIFPNSREVIDNVGFVYAGALRGGEQFILLDSRYYSDDSLRIEGEVLKFIENVTIEMITINEDIYEEIRVGIAGNATTCFDAKGNWYVFYEDTKANVGEYGTQPGNGDVVDGGTTEISCLVSSDLGDTWFDHKGVVFTAGSEDVSFPYAITDFESGNIHLFYVTGGTLMQKEIPSGIMVAEDAFKAWRRPVIFDKDTPADFGVAHFTEEGKQVRQTVSYVVVGNISGEFLNEQLDITEQRKQENVDREEDTAAKFLRFEQAGDFEDFSEGFAQVNYVPFKDARRSLKVLYVENGLLYARISSDSGRSWYGPREGDDARDGLFFHKHNEIEEPAYISNLSAVVDDFTNRINISYIVDGMLFVRTFDSGIFDPDTKSLLSDLDPTSPNARPVFCVGELDDSVIRGLNDKNTNILFPYEPSAIESFKETMSISDIPTVGFVSSSGYTRFYYQDAEGNIRGLTFTPKNVLLDVKQKKRDD